MLPYTFGLKKDGPVTSASEITLLKMIEIHCSKHIQKWVRLRVSFSYDLWTFSISKFCFFPSSHKKETIAVERQDAIGIFRGYGGEIPIY